MRGFGRARAAAASMRPQHITAENALRHEPALLVLDASMRPQHITAENPVAGLIGHPWPVASMRPQHITAENEGHRMRVERRNAALQ